MKPDLTLLYSQLDLKPDCSLAELQLAYRRRISELQPGRHGPPTPESTALLRNIIALYTTANRFHRRYGRLPGGEPRMSPGTGTYTSMSTAYPAAPTPAPTADEIDDEHSAHGMLGFFFVLIILLCGLLAWWGWLDWFMRS